MQKLNKYGDIFISDSNKTIKHYKKKKFLKIQKEINVSHQEKRK